MSALETHTFDGAEILMRVRVLDLDGSITAQDRVVRMFAPEIYDLRLYGPRLRMACRWKRYYRFERRLDRLFGPRESLEPWLSLVGSGDFHHASLALLRRLRRPCNLLVLDRQPDWHRGMPFIHCSNWLYHAAQLPNVRRIFHVGADANLDNSLRWLAPNALLKSGKIVAVPAKRHYRKGVWRDLPHEPLRRGAEVPLDGDRIEDLLEPYFEELDRLPLYISLDKSVLWMPESVGNWDAGALDLNEVQEILQFFLKAAGNDLIGMDVVGDWSEVDTRGWMRYFMHRLGHPKRSVDPEQARLCNERTNLMLLRFMSHDPSMSRIAARSRLKSA